ncbi:putative membrane protein [Melioribacter roseus P3M-2]|uniref:Putative membrane protein n=1 Tax=Melioribacter roseus (strain DSM 23840 / JCM 17771 / VKM B-2668 / P3M-2) TaxID=1191523 RepID=I6ZPN2_MELRP|nr:AI-2E family transporter [Melioribacter roseus]AFN73989.1 putative membrane protein [Melioribacter roseus P3M-2]
MKKKNVDPVVTFFISVVGLVVIFMVLKELRHIFIPFVISYFLYFVFEPMNGFLKQKKIPLPVTILLNIIITLALFGGVVQIIVGRFISFGEALPVYQEKIARLFQEGMHSIGMNDTMMREFMKTIQNINYGSIVGGLFSSTLDIFVSIFLILFFFIFISSGHEKIFEAIRIRYVEKNVKSTVKKLKKELKEKSLKEGLKAKSLDDQLATMTIQREMKLKKTFKDITSQVQKYIITKFLISLTLGVLVGLVLWLYGVEFYVVWATLAFLLNFIPNIGSIIAVILPALMTLIQFESFGYMVLVTATLILVQNILGNIVEPMAFGDRLGLNPLVILISLMLWGYIWGIVGMFLSVPLTAVIKIIISNSSSKNMRFIANLMSN